jgi:hypothetical protein
MYIRIFDLTNAGLEKYINFVALEMGGARGRWQIEVCPSDMWLPPSRQEGLVADIHIYIGIPVRLAIPWARYNVYLASGATEQPEEWAWASKEMDAVVDGSFVWDRKRVLPALRGLFRRVQKELHPPALPAPAPKGVEPVKVGILTATRNRPDWWANMIQNITAQKWPVSHLEWIIIDDGDEGQQLENQVAEFQQRLPSFVVKYVPVPGAEILSIGEKRNMGVRAAAPDVSVFVVMDDDDHYPASSVETRVAWLRRAGTGAAYCGTLPMYDVRRYVSAMSSAPLTDAPESRVAEATLAFTRAFWEERAFPNTSMAEGDGFVEGRVGATVEIPPVGVIVSFIHGGNSSSRHVPPNQPPNGCHYGFSDQFFSYLHENFGAQEGGADELPALQEA